MLSGQTGIKVTTVTVSHSLGAGIDLIDTGRFTTTSSALTVTNAATVPIIVHPNFAGSLPTGSTFTSNGSNVVRVTGGDIVTSQIWPNLGVPYVVTNSVWIDGLASPVLTIPAGVTVKFGIDVPLYVGWDVGGSLVTAGTAANPVILTADATTPTAGHWRGIIFDDVAGNNSSLAFTTIEYAGRSGWAALTFYRDLGAIMTGSTVRFSADCGIERITFAGTWVTDFTSAALANTFASNALGNQCGP